MKKFDTDTLFLFESFYAANEDAFTDGPLLIVGVKSSREVDVSERFRDRGHDVVIAEPWPPNVEIAKNFHPHAEVVGETAQATAGLHRFRTIVWLQGVEHVQTPVVKPLIRNFMQNASLIVLEMPHGIHLQGPDGGNVHEKHVSHWFLRDFSDMGEGWSLSSSHDGKTCNEANESRHLLAVWGRS